MKLLQISEWFGVSNEYMGKLEMEPSVELKGFVTRQSIPEAISSLKKYQDLCDAAYPSRTSCYTLLSVTDLPQPLNKEQIQFMRLTDIDSLPKNKKEMEEW